LVSIAFRCQQFAPGLRLDCDCWKARSERKLSLSNLKDNCLQLLNVRTQSYPCVSPSALEKQQAPIVGGSKSHVSLCQCSKKSHLVRRLVSGVTGGRDDRLVP